MHTDNGMKDITKVDFCKTSTASGSQLHAQMRFVKSRPERLRRMKSWQGWICMTIC